MNGPELADAVATRLEAQVTSRTVYVHAVPDGPLPSRYLLVEASEGDEYPSRAVDAPNVQVPFVWVRSVSRHQSPDVAAREAGWGAAAVRTALRGWRPDDEWRIRSYASVPPGRNEALSATTFFAVEQFRLHSYI